MYFQIGPFCEDLDPCPGCVCRDTCSGKGYECNCEPGLILLEICNLWRIYSIICFIQWGGEFRERKIRYMGTKTMICKSCQLHLTLSLFSIYNMLNHCIQINCSLLYHIIRKRKRTLYKLFYTTLITITWYQRGEPMFWI